MSFFAGLVGLDAFPKANDEYRLKTNTGAIGESRRNCSFLKRPLTATLSQYQLYLWPS